MYPFITLVAFVRSVCVKRENSDLYYNKTHIKIISYQDINK